MTSRVILTRPARLSRSKRVAMFIRRKPAAARTSPIVMADTRKRPARATLNGDGGATAARFARLAGAPAAEPFDQWIPDEILHALETARRRRIA
jgi:hypothetical protein